MLELNSSLERRHAKKGRVLLTDHAKALGADRILGSNF